MLHARMNEYLITTEQKKLAFNFRNVKIKKGFYVTPLQAQKLYDVVKIFTNQKTSYFLFVCSNLLQYVIKQNLSMLKLQKLKYGRYVTHFIFL